MAIAEAEINERLEERAKALGHVANYCPFGCQTENLDEHGYCSHLAGFTNDGKVVETIQIRYRKVKDAVTGEVSEEDTHLRFVSGFKGTKKKPSHLDTVRPGDKLVNPQRMQKGASGMMELASLWVSARVYRPDEKAVAPEVAPQATLALPKKKAAKKKKPAPRVEQPSEESQEVAA